MRQAFAILLLAAPGLALAEVSDKVPSHLEIVVLGLVCAAAVFLLASWKWWFSVLGVLAAALWTLGSADLLGENGLREAVWAELGLSYFLVIAASGIAIVVATALGGVRVWRKRDV
jgi:hypothetical protein